MNRLDHALSYIHVGFHVFPCHSIESGKCSCGKRDCDSPGKHPITRRGHKDASNQEDAVRRWWECHPHANIGIRTGPESGIFVLDLDGSEGIQALKELEELHGSLPTTPVAMTGGGGKHYIFTYPATKVVKSRVKVGGYSIDVRGEGGYVVAPPSNHASGRDYKWQDSAELNSPAEAPPWLLDFIDGKKRRPSSGATSTDVLDAILDDLDLQTDHGASQGERHNRALQLIGSHLGRGESLNEVVPKAREWARRCSPPMDEDELLRIVFDLHEKQLSRLGQRQLDTLLAVPPWPELSDSARHGLLGDIVNVIEPHSEADPVAILVQLIVFFGNVIGRRSFFRVEGSRHHTNLFAVLVGDTAKGRKGTSEGRARSVFHPIDVEWSKKCFISGMSSGEGVIHHVRDPVEERQPVKEKGRVVDYQMVEVDQGVTDKRLMILESEFAQALRVMQRDGNTLSPTIRSAWDSGELRTMTKNARNRASGAHISVVGHITKDEVSRFLSHCEFFNGFANRFLWLCVRRSKLLPDGGQHVDLSEYEQQMLEVVQFAQRTEEIGRDELANERWRKIYHELADGPAGFLGAVTSRAEAQVLRLSMIYSLADQSAMIRLPHLEAAYALWNYAAESARHVFGQSMGDSLTDKVLATIKSGPVTKKQIHDSLNRHVRAVDLDRALAELKSMGLVKCEKVKTGGRPAELWSLAIAAGD